jgi:phage terminase large subunit
MGAVAKKIVDLTEDANEQLFTLIKCHDRYLLPYGGGGSGKSYEVAQKYLLRIKRAESEGYQEGFLCLRKTSPDVKRSVFRLLVNYTKKWDMVCRINLADLSLTFPGGSFISCTGLDDPEKIKSIEDITSIWMEEATQFSLSDFRQLDLRLRGETPSYKQIIMTFNPVDDTSWINTEFFDSESSPKTDIWDDGHSFRIKKKIEIEELSKTMEVDATVIHSTWRNNKFVDDQYVAMLTGLKEKDPERYSIYDQGLWTALAQRIYINYEEILDKDWPEAFDDVWYGLDIGFNSPSALIECCSLDEEIYERELIYEKALHTDDIIAKMRELEIDPNADIYADPSAKKEIDLIKRAGFNIDKADNSVESGIRFVRAKRPRIHQDSINHLREKKSYKYKEDRDGHVLEVPIKANDHAQDAERYALFTHLTKEQSDIWFVGE